MDFTALNEVSEAIIALIQKAVDDNGSWPGLKVVPELLKNENEGIGFYLFHVQENSHFKNYPAAGKDASPVSHTPMGLNLFYQLSATKKKDDNQDAYDEQRLMSVAMKVLHDHAVLEKTKATVTNPAGKDVKFKITLQTLTPSESVQYWAAAESPVKLSAYYEVSVIFLEPEPSKAYAGRVLSYSNYIIVQGAPRIFASENILEYSIPGNPDLQQVRIQPAQVPPAHVLPVPPSLLTPPIDSEIHFFGSGFGGGELQLFLIHAKWNEPVVAGTDWQVKLEAENHVKAVVQQQAKFQNAPGTVMLLPGLYAAQILVTQKRIVPDGTTKEFRHRSNQFPFSVMPRIDTIKKGAGGLFTIAGFLFQDAALLPEEIQVYIGENQLELAKGGGFGAGQFRITGPGTMELKIPAGLPAGTVPLRIMIKGVESPPNWIVVP